jgi:hypothetical protein
MLQTCNMVKTPTPSTWENKYKKSGRHHNKSSHSRNISLIVYLICVHQETNQSHRSKKS